MPKSQDRDTNDQIVSLTGSKIKKKKHRKKKPWNETAVSFRVAYKEELESVFKKQGAFGFKPKCHPDSFVRVRMQHGQLSMDCTRCGLHMMAIKIQKGKDVILKLCQNHLANGVSVSYNLDRVHIGCPFCPSILHKFVAEKNE